MIRKEPFLNYGVGWALWVIQWPLQFDVGCCAIISAATFSSRSPLPGHNQFVAKLAAQVWVKNQINWGKTSLRRITQTETKTMNFSLQYNNQLQLWLYQVRRFATLAMQERATDRLTSLA